jgi:hypothetical protein
MQVSYTADGLVCEGFQERAMTRNSRRVSASHLGVGEFDPHRFWEMQKAAAKWSARSP